MFLRTSTEINHHQTKNPKKFHMLIVRHKTRSCVCVYSNAVETYYKYLSRKRKSSVMYPAKMSERVC